MYFLFEGQLVRMREDEIRIFLQELNRRHFDDDVIITELESVHSELAKSRLATPPLIVELQDISQLNCEALERVRSNPPSPDASIPTHSDIHVLSNGLTPYNNGHHAIGPVR